jgi:hypothetical protein
MQEVSPLAVSHCKDLTFDFSLTKRNEYVDLNKYSSYSFIIDVNGKVYQSGSCSEQQATVLVVGGLDTFINEKVSRTPSFYVTEPQKVTIYAIIRDLAHYSNDSKISSSNSDKLEQSINALYQNYIG